MNNISVVILTYNEIENIPFAIENVKPWASEIVILDSYSSDGTVEFCKEQGCKVFQRKFDNFSNQRKYALNELPIASDWIFVLDADELLTDELKAEIESEISNPKFDAYFIKRRFYWQGKWIKRGYYPTNLLRFGKKGLITCDDRQINEHIICRTESVGQFENDFVDFNRKSITDWIDKHNKYSTAEAEALLVKDTSKYRLWGSQYERKRWIRKNVWNKLPVFIRPLLYMLYRLFIKGGCLDGARAMQYHFLHAFIYRCLIDLKYLETKRKK